jgi:2,5-diketo-D-gluconate reductase B
MRRPDLPNSLSSTNSLGLKTRSHKPVYPIGIGTWGIASRVNPENLDSKYRGVEPVRGQEDAAIEAIRYSVANGQNHIDCAELYGGFYTDEVVGQAINGSLREDLYLADKLWKNSVARGHTRPTVEKMLEKLGTDYLDLLYIHAPWEDAPWREAIEQIDELIDEGIVRQFGISNFNLEQMREAAALARHPVSANQMNFNVLHQDEVDSPFRQFCSLHDIQVVAYQPVKRQEVLRDQALQNIASNYGATPAQIALAWLLKMNTLPIPKAATKAHIDENLKAVEINLSDDDIHELTFGYRHQK